MSIKSVQKIKALSGAEDLILDHIFRESVEITAQFDSKTRVRTYVKWPELWKVIFLKDGEARTFPNSDLIRMTKRAPTFHEFSKVILAFKPLHWWEKPRKVVVLTRDLKKALLTIK